MKILLPFDEFIDEILIQECENILNIIDKIDEFKLNEASDKSSKNKKIRKKG